MARPHHVGGIKQATSPDRPWCIYVLRDPRDNSIRYVGVTHRPKTRLIDHTAIAKSGKQNRTYVTIWIRQLLALNLKPVWEVIESGFGESWRESEIRWIAYHRAAGCRLTNIAPGGLGCSGIKRSEEFCRKISERQKGKGFSALARQRAIESATGRKRSPELIALWREKMKGRKQRPEVVEARALANTGRRHTAESKAKQRAARLGRKFGPRPREVVEKIAAANRGKKRKPHTEEHRALQSIALKGRPWSEQRRNADNVRRLARAMLSA